METLVINRLAELIRLNAENLLTQWRLGVRELPSAKHLDTPTLNDHIPLLLLELADALETRTDESIAEALKAGTPPEHGAQRVEDGFDIAEVVAEYNILRGCVHDLAEAHGLNLQGKNFHILNRVLDGAIGLAVQTFAEQRAAEIQRRREEYLAFVAHDLRNPLNALSLAATMLETSGDPDGNMENAQMIKTLRRNVGQLEALVAKVLEENNHVEAEAGMKLEKRRFDLWPLVQSIIVAVNPLATTGGTNVINEVADELEVFGDAGLLRRVYRNLLDNAIRYSPGGQVLLGARLLHAEGMVECWVTDSGSGIATNRLEKVFEKGEGDPEREESTGLGLAIVKTFIEAHDGKVHAESIAEQGTTIRFRLPMSV